MIFTIAHIKGGIGKSTLACNASVFLAKLDGDENTLLIDADKQRSSSKFAFVRNQLKQEGKITKGSFDCVHVQGAEIIEVLKNSENHYKNIIIDVGGQDNIAMRAALLASDKLLAPFAPRSFDLWSMQEFEKVVKEALKINPKLEIASVCNLGYSSGSDNKTACNMVNAEYPIFKVLPGVITTRKIWSDSSAFGYSITDKGYRDGQILNQFWRVLSGLGFSREQIEKGIS